MILKTIPNSWWNNLALPVISAPMFLVSGPTLVKEACLNGIIGSFPAPNARPIEVLDEWMNQLNEELANEKSKDPSRKIAPWAMNMVVHSTYSRLEDELQLIQKHQPQLVITSLGSPKRVVEIVHGYGGLVFSDVSDVDFARKAAQTGVDGLILVASGAGGHAGDTNSFAFVDMVREFWDGIIVLAGAISSGYGILAAQSLGCDFAYMGTRFIPARESMAKDEYRQMLVESTRKDVILTDAFSGVNANMLIPSITKAGLDPKKLVKKESVNFDDMQKETDARAWKDIWSAGHGVGTIRKVEPIADIIKTLEMEYEAAVQNLKEKTNKIKMINI